MKYETFIERLSQLSAIDRNAFDIYSDLAKRVSDRELSDAFKVLQRDEARHIRLEKEVFSLLQNGKGH